MNSTMKVFVVIALLACLGVVQAGYHAHSVVTPDIIHHVTKVLSHGYGSHVVLGYPEKAHLVDYGVSVHEVPHYGHGYGHHSGHGHHGGHYSQGHGHGHGHAHYGGGGYGHGYKQHYAVPAYLGYAGTGHYHGHHY